VHVIEIPLSGLSSLLESAEPEPHPDLVASITPSPADIMHVALRYGWLPPEPYLNPAVPMRMEE
jgi:hypothetical protein